MTDKKLDINPDVFDEASYQKALDNLKLDHKVKYYTTAEDILRGYSAGDDGQIPRPYDGATEVIENWRESMHTASDGKIPEGAVEVYLDPVTFYVDEENPAHNFRIEDLNDAAKLGWALKNKQSFDQAPAELPYPFHVSLLFTDEKDYNDVDGMLIALNHDFDSDSNFMKCLNENIIPHFAFRQYGPVVSYFRENYDIDFSTVPEKFATRTEHPGQMTEEEHSKFIEALCNEFKSEAFKVCDAAGCDYDDVMSINPEYLSQWAYHTAAAIEEYDTIDNLRAEARDFTEQDIENTDYDEVFIESAYKQQLEDLTLGYEVKYYLANPEQEIQDFVNYFGWQTEGKTADDFLDFLEWADDKIHNTEYPDHGKIPEDAIEIAVDGMEPVYLAEDLPKAMDLACALESGKSLNEINYKDPIRASFCFRNNQDWDRCQNLINQAFEKFKESEHKR